MENVLPLSIESRHRMFVKGLSEINTYRVFDIFDNNAKWKEAICNLYPGYWYPLCEITCLSEVAV